MNWKTLIIGLLAFCLFARMAGVVDAAPYYPTDVTTVDMNGYDCGQETANIDIVMDGHAHQGVYMGFKFDNTPAEFEVNEDEQSTWLMETINGGEEPKYW